MKQITWLITLYVIGYPLMLSTQEIHTHAADGIKTVIISNVAGDIIVQGLPSSRDIALEAQYENAEELRNGHLQMKKTGDTLLFFVEHPCLALNLKPEKEGNSWSNGIYTWQKQCDIPAEIIHISLNLPSNIAVKAKTINDGDIRVHGVIGELTLENINGSILARQVINLTKAKTINGQVDITFDDALTGISELYTLNGDIHVYLPDIPDVNIEFKSRYGDFYTRFENLVPQASTISTHRSDDGFKIKMDGFKRMKLGNPEGTLKMETFNGDIYMLPKSESK